MRQRSRCSAYRYRQSRVPQTRLANGAHNVDVIGGVTALGVEVEVRADGTGGQAEGAALLELFTSWR